MDYLIKSVSDAISGIKSYAAYRAVISSRWPELDQRFKSGPYERYAENLWLWLNSMDERPGCQICSKTLRYIDRTAGYGKYCSTKCAANSPDVKRQHRAANDARSPDDTHEMVARRQATMVQRYGKPHALQVDAFRSRAAERYSQRDRSEISDKRSATIRSRYGVSNMWELPEFRQSIIDTNMSRYGAPWFLQSPEVINQRSRARAREFYDSLSARVPDCTPLFSFDEYHGVSHQYQWQCKRCDTIFSDHIDNGSDPMCTTCFPEGRRSSAGERQLVEFIKTHLGITNLRQNVTDIIPPKELDIWIPDHNLAIEYNGLYWHSELKIPDRSYHQQKLRACADVGVRLIQIFSDEWESRRDIVESRLRHVLGRSDRICGARQCHIMPISRSDYEAYMDKHHMQGTCITAVRLGAFHDGDLVAAMGFGQHRAIFKSRSGWELLRFATSGNIPGIASRMFKHFIKHHDPDAVISYCDLRWGTGTTYLNMGMTRQSTTQPGYWYTKDGSKRLHRFNLSKQKLIAKGFDPNLTESEITKSLGYYRIWDAGHAKFAWFNPSLDPP